MKKIINHQAILWILLILLPLSGLRAQYQGGTADGYATDTLRNTTCGFPAQFFAYFGGTGDGHGVQIQTYTTCPSPPQFYAYLGGIGDGSNFDTLNLINCPQAPQFYAYQGGSSDGHALDTLRNTTCATPSQFYAYFGGNADGYSLDTLRQCPSQPPVAGFTVSRFSLCSGDTVQYRDTSLNSPFVYKWYFTGGTLVTSDTIAKPIVRYNTAGIYTVKLVARNYIGIDSVTRVSYITIYANPVVNLGHDTTICSPASVSLNAQNPGASYLWSTAATSQTISASTSGQYSVRVTLNGCVRSDTIAITVNPLATATVTTTICAGSSYAGHTATGTFVDHYSSALGCDSARTLNLTVLPNSATTVTTSICAGSNYAGHTTTGTFVDHYTSANGCDSARTLNLTILPNATATITTSICAGGSYASHTTTGTFIDHYTSANGCDSARTLYLTVNPNVTTSITATICAGSVYAGHTATGTFVDHYSTVAGCDSARTLNLTVNPNVTATVTTSICAGSNYAGHTITGTFVDHYTSANGCDSARTLNLTVRPNATSAVTTSICAGSNYAGHTTTGSFVDHYTSVNGCDSARTLNLTVLPNASYTVTTSICSGNNYAGHTATGTFVDHYTSANGCDSARTLNLIVLPNTSSTITTSICSGSNYAGHTTSGTFTDHYTSANGCDSARTLNLTVLPNASTSITTSICAGSSYAGHTSTGSFVDHYISTNGCDSTRTLNLTVNSISHDTISQTICFHSSYSFGGTSHDTSGYYSQTLTGANGCDSIVTLHLAVRPQVVAVVTATICATDSFYFHGLHIHLAGVYSDTLIGASMYGCDSIVTLTLSVRPTSTHTLFDTICYGSSVSFGSRVLTGSGIYKDTLTGSNGCDSISVLDLTVSGQVSSFIVASTCQGHPYHFGGHSLTAAGSYADTLISVRGCDSIVHLTLSLLSSSADTIRTSICQGAAYQFHGRQLTLSGTYRDTLAAANTCDSIVVLLLTVTAKPTPVVILSGLDTLRLTATYTSYQWLYNGSLINGDTAQSHIAMRNGSYRVIVYNDGGCSDTSAAVSVVKLGIESVLIPTVKIYPNPTASLLHIEIDGTHPDVTLILIDEMGRIIFERDMPANQTSQVIDLSSLPSSIYSIILRDDQNIFMSRRVIKY